MSKICKNKRLTIKLKEKGIFLRFCSKTTSEMNFLRFFVNSHDKINFWRKVFVSSLAYVLYYDLIHLFYAKTICTSFFIKNNPGYGNAPPSSQPSGGYYAPQNNYGNPQRSYGGPPPAVPVNDGGYGQPNAQPPQQEARDTKDNRFNSYGNYSSHTYYYRMMNTSEGDRKCCCGCCTNRQCASCLFCCECCLLCCECCMCCLDLAG